MSRSESVQLILDTFNPVFLEPNASVYKGKSLVERAKDSYVDTVIYYGKKITDYTSYVVSIPGPLASLVRHINDQIMPNTLTLLQVVPQSLSDRHVRAVLGPAMGLVKFADVFESVNDIQWWINGGFAHSYAKGRYFDILTHVFLVPTNLTGIILFGRDIDSGFMAFLGRWAETLGRIPGASIVKRFAVAPACYVTLCLAYICMTADSIQKGFKYYRAIDKMETNKDDLTLPNGPKISVIEGVRKKAFKFRDKADKEAKINHTKTKLTNAIWDAVVAGSKLAINAIALGVLLKVSVATAISTCPPAMIALACVAIYGVGRGLYLKHMGTQKSQVAYDWHV